MDDDTFVKHEKIHTELLKQANNLNDDINAYLMARKNDVRDLRETLSTHIAERATINKEYTNELHNYSPEALKEQTVDSIKEMKHRITELTDTIHKEEAQLKDLQTNMMAGDQLNRMLEEGKKRLLLKRRQNNINEEGIVTISQNDMNALKEQYEEQLKQLHNDIDHFKEQNDALNDQLKRYED